MRAGEFMRRRADIHARVVQDEILDMDKLALEPEDRRSVVEMEALDESVPHRRARQPLVEPGDRVLGGDQRAGDFAPWNVFARSRSGLIIAQMLPHQSQRCLRRIAIWRARRAGAGSTKGPRSAVFDALEQFPAAR